uniref:Uncharacterized protein n=1 Tax=Arundo donax TaxID=35708 RepID=A0A0A9AL07_ARUDO
MDPPLHSCRPSPLYGSYALNDIMNTTNYIVSASFGIVKI